ncbi:hydrolase, P-loop family [Mitsuokella sp. oral taxon 131 str. W9106]|nr:hydrolase, P-loop family [Mitsuokella sp. oral taxon 131 str. W9106]
MAISFIGEKANNMFTCTTHSPEETEGLAELVGKRIREGTVLCLVGDLGAGKTLFVKSLARTLGVEGSVTSPTFNLMHVYDGICPIYHFDLYRLKREEELDEIGFYEYTENAQDSEGLVIIEWPDKFPSCMPKDYVEVRIVQTGETERALTFSSVGTYYDKFVKELESFVHLGH